MEIKDTFGGSEEDNRYRAPADTRDAQLCGIHHSQFEHWTGSGGLKETGRESKSRGNNGD